MIFVCIYTYPQTNKIHFDDLMLDTLEIGSRLHRAKKMLGGHLYSDRHSKGTHRDDSTHLLRIVLEKNYYHPKLAIGLSYSKNSYFLFSWFKSKKLKSITLFQSSKISINDSVCVWGSDSTGVINAFGRDFKVYQDHWECTISEYGFEINYGQGDIIFIFDKEGLVREIQVYSKTITKEKEFKTDREYLYAE